MTGEQKPRALIVDDEPDNLDLFSRALRSVCDVVVASNGEEALEIMEADPVEVVVSDERMPGMTGSELLTIIHRRWPSTIRLVVSAYSDFEAVVKAINLGGISSYLTKPCTTEAIFDAVQRALLAKQLSEKNEQLIAVLERTNKKLNLELDKQSGELQAARRGLIHAEKMASLGSLAGGITHEINNPLTYVIANHELAIRDIEGIAAAAEGGDLQLEGFPARLRDLIELLEEADHGAHRIHKIVSDLRAFASPSRRSVSHVDVTKCIEDALVITANEIRHRAKVVRDYEDVDTILGDSSQLTQAFVNLLINATQSIDTAGVGDHFIEVRVAQRSTGRVTIDVRDSGAGIPESIQRRIFEPFYTTKDVGAGTGLGLSVCHGMIEGMGGSISVHSAPGEGATFTVNLPSSAVSELTSQDTPEEEADGGKAERTDQRLRVLVIDDDKGVARVIERGLDRDHDVVVAHGGKEACELLQEETALFDIVLCDLLMPGITGMDVYEGASEDTKSRFIFITGSAFTRRSREFLRAVPNPRLEKPFRIDELLRAIESFQPARS